MTYEEQERIEMAGGVFILSGCAFMFGAVAWQAVHWLRTGRWEEWPLNRGFAALCVDVPWSSWEGINIIWDLLLRSPMSIVVGLGLVLIGFAVASFAAVDS